MLDVGAHNVLERNVQIHRKSPEGLGLKANLDVDAPSKTGVCMNHLEGKRDKSVGERLHLFSFAEYLAACCEDEGEENPP